MSSGCSIRTDTNPAVQPQKMARGLKFRIKIEEGLYYPCSENTEDADQLRSDYSADLRLCFRICKKPETLYYIGSELKYADQTALLHKPISVFVVCKD